MQKIDTKIIKQILKLYKQGKGIRAIALITGVSKSTVANYIKSQ